MTKHQSFIKLAKLQKIKVDINKETAGYYKIHLLLLFLMISMSKLGHISSIYVPVTYKYTQP